MLPSSRIRWARRNASTSAAPRSTGWTPPFAAAQPTIGQSNSSFLPSQWIRRPSFGINHEPSTTASRFEAWLAARISGPVARDLVDRTLDGDPAHRPPEDPATQRQRRDQRGDRAVDRGRVVAHALAPLGSVSAARRASLSRIALTTASTVSSKRLPSVEMIRASVCGTKWGDGARGVQFVAPPQPLEDPLGLGPVRVEAALLGPAASPLLDRRLEEDLEVRIGEHDGPDVAAGHHDPAARGELALTFEQGEAQLGDRGDRRDRRIDRRLVDIVGVIDAIDQDAGEPALGVGRQFDLVGEAAHRVRVRGGHAPGEGQPGHGAVEQARIAEPVADLERRGGADAALAGRSRAVDGDDELRAGACCPSSEDSRPVEAQSAYGATRARSSTRHEPFRGHESDCSCPRVCAGERGRLAVVPPIELISDRARTSMKRLRE